MNKYGIQGNAPDSRTETDFFGSLNSEQYEVVMHGDGPMLVLAGAGTGKTTAVTYRVTRLVRTGIGPHSILLLTFTNKAAKEMMIRAERLIGAPIRGMWSGTFHHLCNMILRRHAGEIGYGSSYTIMDREDSKGMFKDRISEINVQGIFPKPAVLAEIASITKNTDESVEDTLERRFMYLGERTEEIKKVLISYENGKKRLNLMDFDDLLVNTRLLLQENETVRDMYRERFRYILVDEYQDTNLIQSHIVDILASRSGNLMVVGDDAQSIYSFRGAAFENIIRFPERYPDAKIFKLTTNYRSTPEILKLANNSISKNSAQFQKELHSIHYTGPKPSAVALHDIFDQAHFAASKIVDFLSEGVRLRETAVLYRSHYQSMELQMELQKRGIPFEVRSGPRFFEHAHIKDVLAYLRIPTNPLDELGWKRVLKLVPGIGNARAQRIFSAVSSTNNPLSAIFDMRDLVPKKSWDAFLLFLEPFKTIAGGGRLAGPSAAIDAVMETVYEHYLYNNYPNADNRAEDITQLSRYASRYKTIEAFLSDLSLRTSSPGFSDDETPGDEAVVLTTVHQAKGLEWKKVFIIGLNDGKFPSMRALKGGDEEEERRLFYVAVTRAEQELILCYTLYDGDSGGMGRLRPSRFILELDEFLYNRLRLEREHP